MRIARANQSADRQLKLPQLKSGAHQILLSIFDGQAVSRSTSSAIGENRSRWRTPRANPLRLGVCVPLASEPQESRCQYPTCGFTRCLLHARKMEQIKKTFALRDDEYFVLGDNSPVSVEAAAGRALACRSGP